MKISWDNIDDFKLTLDGRYRRGRRLYHLIDGCSVCGDPFFVLPQNNGDVCSVSCGKHGKRKTVDVFISETKKVHSNKYDYNLIEYKNNRTKIKIVCPDHGIFEQTPKNHLNGQGCPECSNKHRRCKQLDTDEIFITKAREVHGNRYDYSLVNYIKSQIKIDIICGIHGLFKQRPNDHIQGVGCPVCAKTISRQEIDLTNYIKSIYDGEIITNTRQVIPPYELDVYLSDLNIAFEYNGMYWHNEGVTKPVGYHDMKVSKCKEQGVELHHIWEDDWTGDKDRMRTEIRKLVLGGE